MITRLKPAPANDVGELPASICTVSVSLLGDGLVAIYQTVGDLTQSVILSRADLTALQRMIL